MAALDSTSTTEHSLVRAAARQEQGSCSCNFSFFWCHRTAIAHALRRHGERSLNLCAPSSTDKWGTDSLALPPTTTTTRPRLSATLSCRPRNGADRGRPCPPPARRQPLFQDGLRFTARRTASASPVTDVATRAPHLRVGSTITSSPVAGVRIPVVARRTASNSTRALPCPTK
jgi:hypothetical protein